MGVSRLHENRMTASKLRMSQPPADALRKAYMVEVEALKPLVMPYGPERRARIPARRSSCHASGGLRHFTRLHGILSVSYLIAQPLIRINKYVKLRLPITKMLIEEYL